MSKRSSLILLIAWGITLALLLIPSHNAKSEDSNWLSSPVKNSRRCGYPWGGANPYGAQTFHNAVDLACGMDGAKVMSVADGEVVYVGWWPKSKEASGSGHGIIVAIYHPSSGVYTYYAHLKDTTVEVGTGVSKGDTIGHVGQTGYANNNSHVHFSVATKDPVSMERANCWNSGCWPNPDNYLGQAKSSSNDSQVQESSKPQEEAKTVEEVPQEQVSEVVAPYVPKGYTLEAGLVTEKVSFDLDILDQFVITLAPLRTVIIICLALLAIFWVGGMIYSSQFRRSMATFAVVAVIVIGGFIGVNQVKANSPVFSPPRNGDFIVEGTGGSDWVVELDTPPTNQEEKPSELPQKEEPPSSDGCSLPTKYPEKVLRWCSYIEKWAAERDMDPRMIAAVMLQESGGNPTVLSGSGAVGLLQVMPRDGIAATFHNEKGVPYFSDRPSIEELKDPEFNIKYGSGMLSRLGINEDPRYALLRYGPDPDDLERVYGSRYYYADLILSIYENYR